MQVLDNLNWTPLCYCIDPELVNSLTIVGNMNQDVHNACSFLLVKNVSIFMNILFLGGISFICKKRNTRGTLY